VVGAATGGHGRPINPQNPDSDDDSDGADDRSQADTARGDNVDLNGGEDERIDVATFWSAFSAQVKVKWSDGTKQLNISFSRLFKMAFPVYFPTNVYIQAVNNSVQAFNSRCEEMHLHPYV
jgi:hypothetical protein